MACMHSRRAEGTWVLNGGGVVENTSMDPIFLVSFPVLLLRPSSAMKFRIIPVSEPLFAFG